MKRKQLFNRILYLGLLLAYVAVLVFMSKNAFMYEQTVVKVQEVSNTVLEQRDGIDGGVETYYKQTIKAQILNGERKGKIVTLVHPFTSSGVNDERYRRGNQLFVELNKSGQTGVILGQKRDGYIIGLVGILILLLFMLNKGQGGIILVSLLLNSVTFLIALTLYANGKDLRTLAWILMILFNLITLLCAGGIHKKTWIAMVSTFTTTMASYGIYACVHHFSKRLPYEMMEYVVNPKDLSDLFFVGVLMGSLGAIMDVAISIAAGVAEIVKQSPNIERKALVCSIREMGYDIMGTMVNVLFFTYISAGIPIMIVKIKNGYTLYHLIQFEMVFSIVRFLMGAIGIVLAIPISGLFSILFYKIRRGVDDN